MDVHLNMNKSKELSLFIFFIWVCFLSIFWGGCKYCFIENIHIYCTTSEEHGICCIFRYMQPQCFLQKMYSILQKHYQKVFSNLYKQNAFHKICIHICRNIYILLGCWRLDLSNAIQLKLLFPRYKTELSQNKDSENFFSISLGQIPN